MLQLINQHLLLTDHCFDQVTDRDKPNHTFDHRVIKQSGREIGPGHTFVDFKNGWVGCHHRSDLAHLQAIGQCQRPKADQFPRLMADNRDPDRAGFDHHNLDETSGFPLCDGPVIVQEIKPGNFQP